MSEPGKQKDARPVINAEEAEAFIKAAVLELGPESEAEWVVDCVDILRRAAQEHGIERDGPPDWLTRNRR